MRAGVIVLLLLLFVLFRWFSILEVCRRPGHATTDPVRFVRMWARAFEHLTCAAGDMD